MELPTTIHITGRQEYPGGVTILEAAPSITSAPAIARYEVSNLPSGVIHPNDEIIPRIFDAELDDFVTQWSAQQ